jgi:hypothetical protein
MGKLWLVWPDPCNIQSYICVSNDSGPSIDHSKSIHPWFYSVAVITSGSDSLVPQKTCLDFPGDPGSIPGKTYRFACDLYKFFVFLMIFYM